MLLSHWPGSGVFKSRETGALRGLSLAPTALDPCSLLRPEVFGNGHNTQFNIKLLRFDKHVTTKPESDGS